ncbi:hypothetical protein DFR24_2875 [Panacagrimonas perspica]|uniref:Uncharacterized protein n=1 Tax=Panacagrimonas perspica TaxID=381431 RepID=A0A4R7P3Z4_9GAMM|nr:hypothetical protein [Panacagrimonas perspica]TDU28503.1 hypothetical protein DFR24_2875 [Panacagrimonas perspica]THD00901.1 hypothetical protein B1810_22645 [Panacagrimonas perspica]
MDRPGLRPFRGALALWICLLAACASNAPQSTSSKNVSLAMDAWKGHKVAEAIGMWGMPDSITREGTLGVLVWKADNAAGKPPPTALPAGMAWAVRCARVLSVDPSETIVQARAYGSECSDDPADYAPR